MGRERSLGGGVLPAALLCLWLALPAAGARAQSAEPADDPAGGAIRVYQRHLSAMRHLHCRFAPSCSQYAMDAIATYGLVEGSARAADRLMRCNSSAEGHFPRNPDGLLQDPVLPLADGASAARVPEWLLMSGEGPQPPVGSSLPPERRARLEEAAAFALELELRGDCERASTEYQRVGALADTADAHAWAYARIAQCYFRSAQWYFADRAYLTSAMLTRDRARRAADGYGGAASRFDSGAFVSCARLLADPALAASADGTAAALAGTAVDEGAAPDPAPGFRVAALTGLCAFALGEWGVAGDELRRAAREAPGGDPRQRLLRLAVRAGEGPRLPRRSRAVAGTLSVVLPGAGQAYSGHVRDGFRHLLFNAALLYSVTSLARHGEVPGAVILGGVALPFYVGNVIGAREAAAQFSHERRMELLGRAIAESQR